MREGECAPQPRCRCDCHRWPDAVHHIAPCCYPDLYPDLWADEDLPDKVKITS